jgi:beta-lactamase regulating signal transducer with metallopeptidase domain
MIPSFFHLLTLPGSIRLGWALVHFLWQGLVIAGLLEVALLIVGRKNASLRHLLCGAALFLMTACFAGTYFWQGVDATATTASPPAQAPLVPPSIGERAPSLISLSAVESLVSPPARPVSSFDLNRFMPWVVTLWLAGVVILASRKAGGFFVVWRLRHRGTFAPEEALLERFRKLGRKLGVDSRRISLKLSARVRIPMTMGWLKPIVLLPVTLLSGLTPDEIDLLLAHELAHIRRCDYLVNILQTVVETVFFYHPATWWISRRMRQERENACDDLIARRPADVLAYAKVLVRLEASRPAGSWLASAANGGSLLQRVQRLAGETTPNPAMSLPAILLLVALLAALGAFPLVKAKTTASSTSTASMSAAEARQKGIAALVNGNPILWSDVDKNLGIALIYLDWPSEPKLTGEARRQQVLQRLVDRAMIVDASAKQAFSCPKTFVDDRISAVVKNNYAGNQKAFLQELEKNGESLDHYRKQVADSAIFGYMANKSVWVPLTQYYQAHLNLFPADDKIKITLIALASAKPIQPNQPSGESDPDPSAQLARQILKDVQGGADFDAFAAKYHYSIPWNSPYWFTQEGPSGLPGWLPFKWPEVEKIQPGQVSEIKSITSLNSKNPNRAYFILKVNDRRPASVPATDETRKQRDALIATEEKKLANDWLKSLRAKAAIQRFADPKDNDASIYAPQAKGVDDPSGNALGQ